MTKKQTLHIYLQFLFLDHTSDGSCKMSSNKSVLPTKYSDGPHGLGIVFSVI